MRWIVLLLALLPALFSCSEMTSEQRADYTWHTEMQQQAADRMTQMVVDLEQEAPEAAALLSRVWEGTASSQDRARLAELLATGPQQVQMRVQEATNLMAVWAEHGRAKLEIRQEAGGGWWEEALITGGSALLVGMGIPTSGPLGGMLAGLAPLLEALGLRNASRRRDYHVKAQREGRPGYRGPGDTVPPPGFVEPPAEGAGARPPNPS